MVGPSGMHIVDKKAWREASIHDGRIFRGHADVTEDLALLADLADLADLAENTEGVLVEVGLAATAVHAVAVLAGRKAVRELWVR